MNNTTSSMCPGMEFINRKQKETSLLDNVLRGMLELVKPIQGIGRMGQMGRIGERAHEVGTVIVVHRGEGKELRVIDSVGRLVFSLAFNQTTANNLAGKLLKRDSIYRTEIVKCDPKDGVTGNDGPSGHEVKNIKSISFFDL